MSRRRVALRLMVLVVFLAVVSWPPVLAQEVRGEADAVAVHKAVTARADHSGRVDEARILTRLVASGHGPATILDPTSTDRLRDLDRLLPPHVRDGAAVWDVDLDGVEVRRTLARFPVDDLPLAVSARYALDGAPIAPEDLAGASGEVTARFLVRNLTSEPRRISYEGPDGRHSEEVQVAVPLVASLEARLGPGWRAVEADRGTVVAGPDGSRVVWSMGLFEPLGAVEQELEVTARLDGGELPEVVVGATIVSRSTAEQLDAAHGRFVDGQSDVAVLAFGLEEGRDALHEIADGVGELLEGFIALGDGLTELAEGLDQTADGAGEVAGGAEASAEGAGELAAGAGEAAAGAQELAGALDGLAAGTAGIAEGTDGLASGLDELSDGTGELAEGADTLADGTAELAAAVGELIDELEALAAELEGIDLTPLVTALQGARQGVDAALTTLATAATIDALLANIVAGAETALAGLEELDPDPAVDAIVTTVEGIRDAALGARGEVAVLVGTLEAQLQAVDAALEAVLDGLDGFGDIGAGDLDGLDQLRQAVDGLAAGAAGLAEGVAAVDAGLAASAAGAQQLADGAAEIAAGTDQVADGADELAGGIDGLADGTGALAEGLGELAAGAGELAAALVAIAGGADELAEGLGEAIEGVEVLGDGLEMLADEGIDLLRRAADGTAGDLARDIARIEALEARAGDGIPFGAPDGAVAGAAYEIRLTGAEPFELPPAGRVVAGLVVLGLAVSLGREARRRSGLSV